MGSATNERDTLFSIGARYESAMTERHMWLGNAVSYD